MHGWKDAGLPTVVATPNPTVERGQTLYNANCATCHQGDGVGLVAHFPPLKGDEVVNAPDPSTLVRAILYGAGPMEIKGVPYEARMPGFARVLSDEEVAAIATFVRSHWGNTGPKVNPAVVTKERQDAPKEATK
jgi:mono/diheme cytochrome c family protein